ncbi:hypothetical protein AB0O68_01085 [Streptomyces sp. NPDC087512]|uniref:hypothetical protein n=1 Tax=Streptomyces sp. NPDC087512 TaxID=3155059 RepID=UPI00341D323E
MSHVLPPDALKGTRIGVSVAPSADLDRLGLAESDFRAVLGELVRIVVPAGGELAYGGNLSPDGYTPFLAERARAYAHGRRALLCCLAWTEHRRLPLSELQRRRDQFGEPAEIVCLDADGTPVDPAAGRGEEPVSAFAPETRQRALTGMRRHLTRHTDAHLFLGGRRSGFAGALPGLMEEAFLALEAGRPVYLAAGYGGVTAEIAHALGVGGAPVVPDPADASPPDPRFLDGLARLRALAEAPARRVPPGNGLTGAETRELAGCRDPHRIAALVARGLGRLRGST